MEKLLHNNEIKGTILLNRMYAGSYLQQGNNIGHEVINLIKDDKGDNYIYVNPLGTMHEEYYTDEQMIDTVLLVRSCGIPDTVEILAQAWGLEILNEKEKIVTDHNNDIDIIKETQLEHKITYGTKSFEEIYKNNSIDKNAAYYTFKAKEVRRPKKPIYISFDYINGDKTTKKDVINSDYYIFYLNLDSEYHNGLKYKEINRYEKDEKGEKIGNKKKKTMLCTEVVNFSTQSLKMYIKKGEVEYNKKFDQYDGKYVDQTKVYDKLAKIVNNPEYWKSENNTKKIAELNSKEDIILDTNNNECNIIDLLGCNYDEIVFSNFFQYIFNSQRSVFISFVKTILGEKHIGIPINISEQFTIEREKGHIDLLIIDENSKTIIVIENKIKSDINGEEFIIKDGKIRCQLYDYVHFVNEEVKVTKDNSKNNKLQNKVYYVINSLTGNEEQQAHKHSCLENENKVITYVINKNWQEKYQNYKKYFFIFAPNYSNITEDEIYPKDNKKSLYKLVHYEEIYNFYKNKEKDFEKLRYYKDFLYAIKKHTNKVDNVLEVLTQKRFYQVIE